MPVPSTRGLYRLPREERFERADYRKVFDEGKSFPSRYFVLWLVKVPEGKKGIRMGTVVSKRTFPHAVQRNRARRLMREAFRQLKGGVRDGFWLMMLGRRKLVAPETKLEDVLRDFRRICCKAKIWSGD